MKIVFIILTFFLFNSVNAQQVDTVAHSNKKNTIRWNITPMFLLGPKSIVLGYERVLFPNQTISFNIGYLEKKPFTDEYGNNIYLFDNFDKGGFDFSLDYRFYFKNRNKRLAPDGVYWGPYFSYYNLWYEGESQIFDNNTTVNTIGIKTDLKMYSFGLQLGYQFVIAKYFTVDIIFIGPSFSHYELSLTYKAEIDIDENSEFYQQNKEIIEKIIPGASFILEDKIINSSGKLKFNSFGYRYLVQIGYRF